jgi:phosphatidylglycerophosphatase A
MSESMPRPQAHPDAHTILTNPVHLLAFGFGAGLAPKAPGTAGTLVAVPLAVALLNLPPLWRALPVVLVCLVGVWLCGRSSRALGVHDHPGIVWDEIAGYLLTVAVFPLDLITLGGGFVLFRAFDILKPPPIRQVDRHVDGGLGIMLDDLIAALFAGGFLAVLRWSLDLPITAL